MPTGAPSGSPPGDPPGEQPGDPLGRPSGSAPGGPGAGPATRALPTLAARLQATRLQATRLPAIRLPAIRLPAARVVATRLQAARVAATRLQAARVAAWRDKRVLQFLVLWAVASPLAALLVYAVMFPDEHRLDLLARQGVDTTAVVVRVDGDTVQYRFRAGSAEHRDSDRPRAPNRVAAELKAGDRVAIAYDPDDVGTSCACDPALLERPPTGWAYLTWFVLGITGVAAYIYQRELRRLGRYLARRLRELQAARTGRTGRTGQVRGEAPDQ